jgi:hypothetical protein
MICYPASKELMRRRLGPHRGDLERRVFLGKFSWDAGDHKQTKDEDSTVHSLHSAIEKQLPKISGI